MFKGKDDVGMTPIAAWWVFIRSGTFSTLVSAILDPMKTSIIWSAVLSTVLLSACKKDDEKKVSDAPTLQLPVNEATSVSHFPTFSWNAAGNAELYDIQISRSGGSFSSSDLMDTYSTTSTSYKNASLYYANDLYYWRVRGKSSEGDGPWSEVRRFGVDANSPDQPGPVFGSIVLYDPDLPDGMSYTIQMSQNGDRTLSCAGSWQTPCSAEEDCTFLRYTGIYSTTYYVTARYATGPNTGAIAYQGSVNGSLGSCQRVDLDDL